MATRSRGVMVPAKCQWCGCAFLARATELARGAGKFCSKSCSAYHRNKIYKPVPVCSCAWCGKPVHRKPSRIKINVTARFYCNRACYLNVSDRGWTLPPDLVAVLQQAITPEQYQKLTDINEAMRRRLEEAAVRVRELEVLLTP